MSKIFVVFGATGQQGGSIIDIVLNDTELCNQFKIRAVTRDPSKSLAQALVHRGVDVVAGDVRDPKSLAPIFQNAHTVFLITGVSHMGITHDEEMAEGKGAADAAVAAGVQCLIYSTLPRTSAISGGKYTKVKHFNTKADVEQYIRQQPIKSAFFAPGSFMSNYESVMKPRATGDGTYGITSCSPSTTQLPLVDIAADTGKFIGAMLADPGKFEGKVLCAATKLYTMDEIAEIMSKSSGKTVKYTQVPGDVFAGFMPSGRGEEIVEMMYYFRDFGYYGPESKDLVAWAVDNARGKVTTFEEYLTRVPLKLE